jgi:hypothetical protein
MSRLIETGADVMSSLLKIWLSILILISVVLAVGWYALFHGYFDHGQFEIKQSQWSSTGQVAMLAERSDHEALGGLEYYVLIGNHLFTPAELRHALHSNAVVFDAASNCLENCLELHWNGLNRLTIRCNGSSVDRDHINVQRRQFGTIAISYENIALM